MLKYALLTGLFRVYLLGVFLFWMHAISVSLFGKEKRKAKRIIGACLIAFIWPLALFSPEGRQKLLINAKQL